jgi:hypothetical protein
MIHLYHTLLKFSLRIHDSHYHEGFMKVHVNNVNLRMMLKSVENKIMKIKLFIFVERRGQIRVAFP